MKAWDANTAMGSSSADESSSVAEAPDISQPTGIAEAPDISKPTGTEGILLTQCWGIIQQRNSKKTKTRN